jgi:hypothetical protein
MSFQTVEGFLSLDILQVALVLYNDFAKCFVYLPSCSSLPTSPLVLCVDVDNGFVHVRFFFRRSKNEDHTSMALFFEIP